MAKIGQAGLVDKVGYSYRLVHSIIIITIKQISVAYSKVHIWGGIFAQSSMDVNAVNIHYSAPNDLENVQDMSYDRFMNWYPGIHSYKRFHLNIYMHFRPWSIQGICQQTWTSPLFWGIAIIKT